MESSKKIGGRCSVGANLSRFAQKMGRHEEWPSKLPLRVLGALCGQSFVRLFFSGRSMS